MSEHWQNCCTCDIRFGVSTYFDANRRKDKASFYCPNGHSQSYTENEADRLRRDLNNAKQQIARAEDEKRIALNTATEQRNRALKAEDALAKSKKRAHAGTCQCCNRTFANVAQHMRTKHPEIVPFKKVAKVRAANA